MIKVGSVVRTIDGSFEGRVLGRHGSTGSGGAFEYKSLPTDLNISIYAVLSDSTGEVRSFTSSGIKLVEN